MLIDGFTPLKVIRPGSVAELGDCIRASAADKYAIYPVGGATTLNMGLPPKKPGVAVDITALNDVIDYPARDMTITVQAGISLAKLQAALASENQWLPIDVPQPEKSTLGGAIAVNASGSRRYGYGTLRDYLIGITVMTDEGAEAKAGGRVVKNVAGYDLMKLHIGALGTLGIISQVTLKVRPRPESSKRVCIRSTSALLTPLLDQIHASKTRPVCVDVVHDAPDWVIEIGFDDNADAVRWQQRQLADEIGMICQATVTSDRNDALASMTNTGTAVAFRANMLPSAVPEFLIAAVDLAAPNSIRAHAGSGIVCGTLGNELTLAQATPILVHLRNRAIGSHGSLIVTHCPLEWKHELPLWGEPRPDWQLMRSVKTQLDPQNLFNPGRFIV